MGGAYADRLPIRQHELGTTGLDLAVARRVRS